MDDKYACMCTLTLIQILYFTILHRRGNWGLESKYERCQSQSWSPGSLSSQPVFPLWTPLKRLEFSRQSHRKNAWDTVLQLLEIKSLFPVPSPLLPVPSPPLSSRWHLSPNITRLSWGVLRDKELAKPNQVEIKKGLRTAGQASLRPNENLPQSWGQALVSFVFFFPL